MSRAAGKKPSPPPAPSPTGPNGQPLVKWVSPQYRGSGGRLPARPLGAPPVVPMVTPVTEPPAEVSPPTSSAPPAPAATPAPPQMPLESAAARPRAWAPPRAPAEGSGNDAHATNAYEERLRDREERQWHKAKDVPQGETLLVHAWAHALTLLPANGMTIWLRRVEPEPAYEFSLDGAVCAGQFPDRKVYEEASRKRKQPTLPERFIARIRGRLPDGSMVELQGGEISFPPEPAQATQPPWIGSAPVWPGYGAPPYGMPPPPYPMMGPGPYGMAQPPYGMPPGYPPPYGYGMPYGYAQQPQPAAASSGAMEKVLLELASSGKANPDTMLNLLRVMQEGQKDKNSAAENMNATLLKLLFERQSAGGGADPLEQLRTMAALVNELRGPQDTGKRGGIVIHKHDGSTLVENDEGLDVTASVGLNMLPLAREWMQKRAAAAAMPKPSGRPPPAATSPAPAKAPPPRPSPTTGTNGTGGPH